MQVLESNVALIWPRPSPPDIDWDTGKPYPFHYIHHKFREWVKQPRRGSDRWHIKADIVDFLQCVDDGHKAKFYQWVWFNKLTHTQQKAIATNPNISSRFVPPYEYRWSNASTLYKIQQFFVYIRCYISPLWLFEIHSHDNQAKQHVPASPDAKPNNSAAAPASAPPAAPTSEAAKQNSAEGAPGQCAAPTDTLASASAHDAHPAAPTAHLVLSVSAVNGDLQPASASYDVRIDMPDASTATLGAPVGERTDVKGDGHVRIDMPDAPTPRLAASVGAPADVKSDGAGAIGLAAGRAGLAAGRIVGPTADRIVGPAAVRPAFGSRWLLEEMNQEAGYLDSDEADACLLPNGVIPYFFSTLAEQEQKMMIAFYDHYLHPKLADRRTLRERPKVQSKSKPDALRRLIVESMVRTDDGNSDSLADLIHQIMRDRTQTE